MHFGDGTYKDLDMTAKNPWNAVAEAKDWVNDNAWFEVQDEQGDVLASTPLGH